MRLLAMRLTARVAMRLTARVAMRLTARVAMRLTARVGGTGRATSPGDSLAGRPVGA